MRSVKRTTCCLLTALSLITIEAGVAMDADTLREVKKSVVRVQARQCANDAQNGSGFLYGKANQVVTALHVIAGCQKFSVYHEESGNTLTATVLKTFKKADMAVLTLSASLPHAVLTRSNLQPEYNDRLIVIGYEANAPTMDDTELRVTSGSNRLADMLNDKAITLIKQVGMPSVDLEILRFDGHLIPGISGGPILNKQGEVVGIADGGLESGTASISWGVPIKNFYHLMSGNELDMSGQASGDGTLTASRVFSADTDINMGKSINCGQFTFRKMRTRSLNDLYQTSDSPMGISQLINAAHYAGHANLNPGFDIYIHQASGGAFAIPQGWEVEKSGNHCRAYNDTGSVEIRLAGAQVSGPMDAQQVSVNFESMLLENDTLLAQIDPNWSYLQPFVRSDGLVANRKSAMLYSQATLWQPPMFNSYVMETLLVRYDAFLGIAAFDRSLCRINNYSPGCDPSRPVNRDFVEASLGAALSTFPCGRTDKQFAAQFAGNNVQAWNNGYCG
ncbi:S1 family peptidase [Alteromonas sp. H39]|uniref:S1 family peptidase n=1 Tax=Alteromonas sp. H39 TaxID=3389876 RepID=UPI0039E09458